MCRNINDVTDDVTDEHMVGMINLNEHMAMISSVPHVIGNLKWLKQRQVALVVKEDQ